MAKLTAWLVTILGVLLVLMAPGIAVFSMADTWVQWVIAIVVLAIGIGKLVRNYKK